jgi:hypothetical protein
MMLADSLVADGLIHCAALHLRGETRVIGLTREMGIVALPKISATSKSFANAQGAD